jgi:hypothetical protein
MIDPNLKLREAISPLLVDQISYQGNPVPVYNEYVPDNAAYPRIVVKDQTNVVWSTLDKYGNEHDITFEIVDKDVLGARSLDIIAGLIKSIDFSNLDLSPEFAIGNGPIWEDLTFMLPSEDGGNLLIRQLTLKLYLLETI